MLPRPGSAFSTERCGIDWRNAAQVAAVRAARFDRHQALADEAAWVDAMRAAGDSDESIARLVVDMRNNARMARCTPEQLPALFERNLARFDTPHGPSVEFLLADLGSPAAVIAAGRRTDAALDVLAGIAVAKESW